jgi:hypothetical protein
MRPHQGSTDALSSFGTMLAHHLLNLNRREELWSRKANYRMEALFRDTPNAKFSRPESKFDSACETNIPKGAYEKARFVFCSDDDGVFGFRGQNQL